MVARGLAVEGKSRAADIHFSDVTEDDRSMKVLIMFEPSAEAKPLGKRKAGRNRVA
jgi:hypothetical protein